MHFYVLCLFDFQPLFKPKYPQTSISSPNYNRLTSSRSLFKAENFKCSQLESRVTLAILRVIARTRVNNIIKCHEFNQSIDRYIFPKKIKAAQRIHPINFKLVKHNQSLKKKSTVRHTARENIYPRSHNRNHLRPTNYISLRSPLNNADEIALSPASGTAERIYTKAAGGPSLLDAQRDTRRARKARDSKIISAGGPSSSRLPRVSPSPMPCGSARLSTENEDSRITTLSSSRRRRAAWHSARPGNLPFRKASRACPRLIRYLHSTRRTHVNTIRAHIRGRP